MLLSKQFQTDDHHPPTNKKGCVKKTRSYRGTHLLLLVVPGGHLYLSTGRLGPGVLCVGLIKAECPSTFTLPGADRHSKNEIGLGRKLWVRMCAPRLVWQMHSSSQ